MKTIVIGSGQAGLSTGYYLKQLGCDFVILDANPRIGDVWRKRWDSLRLFTPARFDSLPGLRFPAPPQVFPTKDEMGDYLEMYAHHFELPVECNSRVDCLTKQGDKFVVTVGERRMDADNVVVAMANYQKPRVPAFARELAPEITQIHSSAYRNPSQLQPGDVLIVGAGNSGAEISMEVAHSHKTWLSGRSTGHLPFRVDSVAGRTVLTPLVLRGLFHRVLTTNTPIGRKVRPKVLATGGPLIRQQPKTLTTAGIVRVPRTASVHDGRPQLEDGRVLDVANVIWCTGFEPGFAWIDLPIFGQVAGQGWTMREPIHRRGIVEQVPGLYFVGLHFLYSMSSTMVHGVCRDAEYIARAIAARERSAVAA